MGEAQEHADMSIMNREQFAKRAPSLVIGGFLYTWKYYYWVEFKGNWQEVEKFASTIIPKHDLSYGPTRGQNYHSANFETWSNWDEGNYFGCYDEVLALRVNGKFGVDVV